MTGSPRGKSDFSKKCPPAHLGGILKPMHDHSPPFYRQTYGKNWCDNPAVAAGAAILSAWNASDDVQATQEEET